MPIRLDETRLEEKDRLAAVVLAIYTLRAMEEWRQRVHDYDCVMIMQAVVAIRGERLLRSEEDAHGSLATPIAPEKLPRCNISSIAHATGLNRETTRRKVNDLIRMGLLDRQEDGSITFHEGMIQEPQIRELVRRQLRAAATLANRLLNLGVFKGR